MSVLYKRRGGLGANAEAAISLIKAQFAVIDGAGVETAGGKTPAAPIVEMREDGEKNDSGTIVRVGN